MKKTKILSSLIMVFLLTGCTVKTNITINKDLSVKEEIHMSQPQDFFDGYYKSSPNNIIEMLLNTKDRKETLISNNYSYEKKITDSFKGVIAERNYISLEDYVNNSFSSKQVFLDFKYNEFENIVTIKANNFWKPEEDDPERYFYNNLNINISLPFVVTDSNADKIIFIHGK